MAVTAETRTHLIGLSVVMLGSAPGTDLLNEWVALYEEGMSLEEIANHIAASDAFQSAYPAFLTNREFAEAMLDGLIGAETVSPALKAAAVEIVVGLLNDGTTRGALALAAVGALSDIHAQGEAHPSYGDFGMVATGVVNKIEVATYYTVELRQAGPNSRVLSDIGSTTGLDDIRDGISDYLDPAAAIQLTSGRDNVVGTAAADRIVSEPDSKGDATLGSADTIDGGDGRDSLEIYDIQPEGLEIDSAVDADVMNVEQVYISSRHGVDVDLTGWEGLEELEVGRFGGSDDVSVKVDGASVSLGRAVGGDATVVGAAGGANVTAGKTSAIKVGSGAHTTSVMTKGGSSVDVNLNGAGGQSTTVTAVAIDGVAGEGLGGDGKRGNPMEAIGVTVRANNDSDTASDHTAAAPQYVMADGTTAVMNSATGYYKAASQTPTGGGTLAANTVIVTMEADDAEMREQMFKDGKRVDPDTEGAVSGRDSGGVPIHVNSDAIEHVALHNTYATIAVINKSKEAEDLMITVDKYGGAIAGKFCITGDGAAENVSIAVAGDSVFDLANNATKTISIMGAGDLTLGATNFVGPPANVNAGGDVTPAASVTLESVTNSGSGKLTMDVAGTAKLKTIDGSASSGGSSITGVHDAVTAVHGGSGADAVSVAGFAADGLTVELGAGADTFSAAGGNGKSRVDGGAGMDVLHLTGNSATYKADGKDVSIYSNFETLDVGGSAAATHDIGLLGVGSVRVSASTADSDAAMAGLQASTVTLANMSDGMGIAVDGKASMGTEVVIVHQLPERDTGERRSRALEVALTANGSKTDTKDAGTGVATLTLTVDPEIEFLDIVSNANPAGKAAAGKYENKFMLMHAVDADGNATASSVEEIVVTGNAALTVSLAPSATDQFSTEFANLETVDASANTGGVNFVARMSGQTGTGTILTQDLEIVGGSGDDGFTGGVGADKLTGGGGDDRLNGGANADTFKYAAASESRIVWHNDAPRAGEDDASAILNGNGSGFDIIWDWDVGTGDDKISLGATIYNGLHRGASPILNVSGTDSTDKSDNEINGNDGAGVATADSIREWLGDGKGVFESVRAGTTGLSAVTDQHAITTVRQFTLRDSNADGMIGDGDNAAEGTWVLIDVDADFDASVDMAIFLHFTTSLAMTADDFSA